MIVLAVSTTDGDGAVGPARLVGQRAAVRESVKPLTPVDAPDGAPNEQAWATEPSTAATQSPRRVRYAT